MNTDLLHSTIKHIFASTKRSGKSFAEGMADLVDILNIVKYDTRLPAILSFLKKEKFYENWD